MPVMQFKQSIAANTTEGNILQGKTFEFLPYNSRVDFGFNQSATGLEVDVHSGQDLLCSQFEPLISATYPKNEEMDFMDLVANGERLTVKVTNTTGGALDLYVRILVGPI